MKYILLSCMLLACCTAAVSQTGKVTGWVRDIETKMPLELATVSILQQDSSLISYQLSDKNGKFSIDKIPAKKKLLLSVSYTGFNPYYSSIQLEAGKTDSLSVFLSLNTRDVNGITVTATVPVRMNGDTLEINPAAFKMKESAVVEELLNQVSGITIWSDGSITVNGKKVQSVLVDGKPFMGSSDSRVATQNLPKTAIDRIQLYQEFDRSNINQQSPTQDSLLTMNIKLKENAKKGYFGKAGGGYGTTSRFESDLSFQTYDKKMSAGIGGGFNNINKNIGSLHEMFQNNTFRNMNPNLYSVGRFGTNGISKNHSFGTLFTHNFIESTNSRQNNRVVLNYNKAGNDTYISDLILQNRTTLDNQQFIREEGNSNNMQNRHDIGFNFVKTNSYNDNFNLNGGLNFSNDKGSSSRLTEVRDTLNRLQSTNTSSSRYTRKSESQSVNMSFAKSDFENPVKNFTLHFNARRGHSVPERYVNSAFQSFTDWSKNTNFNRQYTSDNQSLNLGGTLDYSGFKRMLLGRYNLFGISLQFSQTVNYARTTDHNVVRDYDSTVKSYISNTNLTNFNKRELFDYTPSLSLAKSFHKNAEFFSRFVNVQLRVLNEMKTDKNHSSFAKRNVVRSFQFPRYEGGINYNRQRREKYQYHLSVNYSKNYEYPSVDQLYTIVDDINVYDIRLGNPLLRNRTNHSLNLSANFNTQYPKSVYSVNGNINGSFRRSLNPVTDSLINDFSGKRTHYYVNADKSDNMFLNYSFNISRKMQKSQLQIMYSGQYSTGTVPNFIDGISNISETKNFSNQINLQYSLRSILVLSLGQGFYHNKSKQTASELRDFTNRNNSTRAGVVLNLPGNVAFSSTADRVANSTLPKPTFLWNAFATCRIMKDQGELKISAMDILKQYQNIFNSANAYGTTTRISNGLQQYFLLTLSYYPRKFGKTEIKRRPN